jgi:putative transposase
MRTSQILPGGFFKLAAGHSYDVHDKPARLRKILGPELVLMEDLKSGETYRIHPCELRPIRQDTANPRLPDLAALTQAEIEQAEQRFAAIKPLLNLPTRTRADVEASARQAGVNYTTLYNWIRSYQQTGHTTSLISEKRGPKVGSTKISRETNAIIEDAIENDFKDPKRTSIPYIIELVLDRCRQRKIKSPHPNTIRNRIYAISPADLEAARGNKEKAKRIGQAAAGTIPDVDYPLACVQIDHCRLDIQIVDPETRQPYGVRPWLTLAIDVYSRMVTGYHLTLLSPSAFAAGAAIYMSMMRKTKILETLKLPGSWPVYGQMKMVHADNAREFKGKVLELALDEHRIGKDLRPLTKPEYGAHIERLIGNVNREMRNKNGATQNKPGLNPDYDPIKNATLTLSELELEIVDWIVNIYHVRLHTGIQTTPLKKWNDGVASVGLADISADHEKLRLDFLPFEERTIQNYGVEIHGVTYYDPKLNRWINSLDPKHPTKKRKFIFRIDPQSMKFIWFFDPDLNQYLRIPTSVLSRPDISWSEYNEYRKKARAEGISSVDENSIFECRQRSIARQKQAENQTKLIRRGVPMTRSKPLTEHIIAPGAKASANPQPSNSKSNATTETNAEIASTDDDPFFRPAKPFADIEI